MSRKPDFEGSSHSPDPTESRRGSPRQQPFKDLADLKETIKKNGTKGINSSDVILRMAATLADNAAALTPDIPPGAFYLIDQSVSLRPLSGLHATAHRIGASVANFANQAELDPRGPEITYMSGLYFARSFALHARGLEQRIQREREEFMKLERLAPEGRLLEEYLGERFLEPERTIMVDLGYSHRLREAAVAYAEKNLKPDTHYSQFIKSMLTLSAKHINTRQKKAAIDLFRRGNYSDAYEIISKFLPQEEY